MSTTPTPIAQYRQSEFSAPLPSGHRVTHDVYCRGEGRPVLLIQELPGIGQETLALADRLVEAGFEVILPHLFGPIGRTALAGNLVRVMCLRKEFTLFAKNSSSPIVDWLRALCIDVRDSRKAAGVGVIGMCLTGNFAISLIGDDSVLAAVASQPSMPLHKQTALHMSQDEITAARDALDRKGAMLAYRFDGDVACRHAKFEAIQSAFNSDGNERVNLHVLPGNKHSVLTLDFVDEAGHPTHKALQEVIAYFQGAL